MSSQALSARATVSMWRGLISHFSFESKLARSGHYRPDIDGLRALAVLPVLFYHTELPGFSGGYVGVDIFYVISGYLITSIIAKDILAGRFSFVSFYERRIRRIFPALFGVVLFCILAGAVFLEPNEFASFGKSLLAMTFFVSNIYFKRTGGVDGYFGNEAHSQVLLHTWSLSVEEQFYLFFPTVLILLSLVAKKRVRECLWGGVAVSFAINVWAMHHSPRAAFYLLIPRAWELLLGALLAVRAIPLLKSQWAREIVNLTGLGLIAWAVVMFTHTTEFPGYAALSPCVGAAMIIYAGENGESMVRKVLSFRPLVFIGVISYSLYLYHWPIIVFTKYLSVGALSTATTVFVIVFSLLMPFISYEFIEAPFRGSDSVFNRRQIFTFGAVTSIASAALGMTIYANHGIPGRFSAPTRELIAANAERKNDYEEVCSNWKKMFASMADVTLCTVGDQSGKKILFWGDSHIQQLYPLVEKVYEERALPDMGAIFAIAAGCSPAEHMNRVTPGFDCDTFTRLAMQRAEQDDVDTVFMGFAAPYVLELCRSEDGKCLERISEDEAHQRLLQEVEGHIRKLKSAGKRVIVSLPFPLFDKSIPDLEKHNAILHRLGWDTTAREVDLPSMRDRLVTIANNSGVEVFDPRKSLCSAEGCVIEFHGVSIYKDHSHIAASQIEILKSNMETVLQSRAAPGANGPQGTNLGSLSSGARQ
jgi:peptidoglycan/LPS O-acetylase OafA/YrhL